MVENAAGKKPSHGPDGTLPFGRIVGQEELKQALLAVAVNDDLSGLLVCGEKGTAKSTAVRALRDLLPTQHAVADCPYGCPPDDPASQCPDCCERTDPPVEERFVPLVTLPLGATRERVVGTLSVADALAGDYEFDPGLLARANRGILYVDEVNLLDDHLVDVLLDAAADGVNRVERDGVSVTHPAEFTLVGTMNPEEGDLRPQLRDRFALQATVTGCADLEDRVAVIDRALGRDDGDGADDTAAVRDRLHDARDLLTEVALSREFTEEIAELCRDAGVDGHRADISTARAARTFAALDGRPKVVESDVRRAAELALPHRLESRPFEDAPDPEDVIDDHFEDAEDEASEEQEEHEGDEDGESDADDGGADAEPDGRDDGPDSDQQAAPENEADDGAKNPNGGPGEEGSDDGTGDEQSDEGRDGEQDGPSPAPSPTADGTQADADVEDEHEPGNEDPEDAEEATPLLPGQSRAEVGESRAPDLETPEVSARGAESGMRSRAAPSPDNDGARVRTQRADANGSVDAAASIRSAAARGSTAVESRDLRQSVRAGEAGALVLFVVDASASMRPAMRAAKGTVLELLKDAYQHRDEVGFVMFAGDDAEVVLPPTDSVTLAARHLKELPSGDRTPLPAGLRTATDVLHRADPDASLVVVVTDGRANVAAESPVRETREAARSLGAASDGVLVVDAGDPDATTLTEPIREATDGERVPLETLSADYLDAAMGPETEL